MFNFVTFDRPQISVHSSLPMCQNTRRGECDVKTQSNRNSNYSLGLYCDVNEEKKLYFSSVSTTANRALSVMHIEAASVAETEVVGTTL